MHLDRSIERHHVRMCYGCVVRIRQLSACDRKGTSMARASHVERNAHLLASTLVDSARNRLHCACSASVRMYSASSASLKSASLKGACKDGAARLALLLAELALPAA